MKNIFLAITLFLFSTVVFGQAGPGAIFQSPNILLLKSNLKFKDSNILILTNDTNNPTVVAKNAPQGSLYIRSGTGVLYQKMDNGLSLNWQPLLVGPAGSGTDECVARWDGTGSSTLQNSIFCITDAGIGSGLTQLNLENLRMDLNTVSSTSGDLNLSATGNVVFPARAAGRFSLFDTGGALADSSAFAWSGSTMTVTGKLITDNLGFDLNTISSENANGNVVVDTNGTGILSVLSAATITGRATVQNLVLSSGAGAGAGNIFLSSSTANGLSASTGTENIGIGTQSLSAITSGSNNIAIGYQSMVGMTATGNSNTSVGYQSSRSLMGAIGNSAFGTNALYQNISADYNSALGFGALFNTTGANNSCMGKYCLVTNTTGANNTAVGFEAGYLSTASSNVYLGYQAGYSNTSANKLFIDNSNTATPLIGGDFSTDIVTITGNQIISGLTASLPTKTNGSKQLISAAIDLASATEVTGVLDEPNGGTNQSTYAVGDQLVVLSANTFSKRSVGAHADGEVWTLVSGVGDWAPAAGASGGRKTFRMTLNGLYGGVAAYDNVDLAWIAPAAMKIYNVYMFVDTPGSGGTTELDLKVKPFAAGAFTSIFSTTPKATSSAVSNTWAGVGDTVTGFTAPVLTSSPLSVAAKSAIRMDLISAQTGSAAGVNLVIEYEDD